MKPSRARRRAKETLAHLTAARIILGDIRPSDCIEPKDATDLSELFDEVKHLVNKLEKMLKGGER